jgi:hypothetical protein
MKTLIIPLAFLIFGSMTTTSSSYAQSNVSRPGRAPIYSYCEESRFENYITLATAMRDFVTPEVYSDLYIPLKKKASKAKITLKNYGALSGKTHAAVLDIVKFVEAHDGEFNALWEVEAFFKIAQDLMDMTQALARDLE